MKIIIKIKIPSSVKYVFSIYMCVYIYISIQLVCYSLSKLSGHAGIRGSLKVLSCGGRVGPYRGGWMWG